MQSPGSSNISSPARSELPNLLTQIAKTNVSINTYKFYEHLSDYRAPEFTSNASEFHVTLWNLNFDNEITGEIAINDNPLKRGNANRGGVGRKRVRKRRSTIRKRVRKSKSANL